MKVVDVKVDVKAVIKEVDVEKVVKIVARIDEMILFKAPLKTGLATRRWSGDFSKDDSMLNGDSLTNWTPLCA